MLASETNEPSHCISHAVREQLLMLDAHLRVQAASNSFYSCFEVVASQTLGKQLAEIGNGQWNIPALLTLLEDLPNVEGEFDDFEVEHDFPALGCRTMLVSGRRLERGTSEAGMILLSIRDVTEQKRAKAEAGELLIRFRTTLASIGDAVIVTDPDSRITFMNATAEKLTGWEQNEALQKHLTDVFKIVNEKSFKPVESPVAKAIREGAVVGLANHTILIARDSSEWPIDDSAAPIWDSTGRIAGVVLVFHDISNRRKAEHEFAISELRYRRLFESAHDGILILDAGTAKAVDVNPFMTHLLGYPREYFLGKELWELGVFKDAACSKSAMEALQRVGQIRYEDLPLQHKDGHQVPVEFVSNVYREGRCDVIQCNIRDITERKHLVRDLEKAREDAEAANRSKSEFLANMSHEIRTPMTAILGFADIMLTRSPEECAEAGCVPIIRRNALHLLELVNDILDLSKVEAGEMKIERNSCDLPALLSDIISLMRPRAVEKGLQFGVTFQSSIPRVIQSDSLRLRQILVNLLGNAVKFTESGNIEIRIADEGEGGAKIVLRVDVVDSGIGMTSEQMCRLFQPFMQADESITRKFGGTGLGLTISRRFAKLLNGDITVTSRPGVGSTFTLKIDGGPSVDVERLDDLSESTLPIRLDAREESDIQLSGRILLVEDGDDNQRLLRMQLARRSAIVTSALDGKIAVDMATTQIFDLILMDMQMPVMDGYAATIELRRRGLKIPIIALTAHAMADDRDKCLASGCTAYLSKPVEEKVLLKTVHQYLGSDSSTAARVSAGANIPGSPFLVSIDGDSNRIKSSLIGDPGMMEIIPEFVAGLSNKVIKMMDLLELKDLPGLQRIAHQLLGAAGAYGFPDISTLAKSVEQSVKAGQPLETVTNQTMMLVQLIRRVDGYDESRAT